MKKWIVVLIVVGAMAALLAGVALAAVPVTPTAQCGGSCTGGYTPGMGMMGGGGMMRRGAVEWAGESEELEALLGMTAEQIHTERLAGKSLVEIAAAKGISKETLISTILDAKRADLAALVAAGKLTQEQADYMIEHMASQVETMVERTTMGPAFGQGEARYGATAGMGQGFRGGRGAIR